MKDLENRKSPLVLALVAGALVLAAGEARAQFNVQWVGFENESSRRLIATSALGLTDPEEKDYAWGDVDKDASGPRRGPEAALTSPGAGPRALPQRGRRPGGPLAEFASDTDVPGDQGFLTPPTTDVVLADFNGDVARHRHGGDHQRRAAQAISHPGSTSTRRPERHLAGLQVRAGPRPALRPERHGTPT